MLAELVVTDMGPIERIELVLGDGMTVLTGETGAGKTLLTEAIQLLLGGRADGSIVRAGADEAIVEGRFVLEGQELVLRRVVPADGRSRAYVDGQLATASRLTELGEALVDIHGQHGHQALTRTDVQRSALDRYGGLDNGPLSEARTERRRLEEQLASEGGDALAREREIDLYRFQLEELRGAGLESSDEDELLQEREALLADATSTREATARAIDDLGHDGAHGAIARALQELSDLPSFGPIVERLTTAEIELGEIASDLRVLHDEIVDDPRALAEVQQRRQVLSGLKRKYGTNLGDVITYRDQAEEALAALESFDERTAALREELSAAVDEEQRLGAELGAARRALAPGLAAAVQGRLEHLALPNAQLEMVVGDDPGDRVELRVAMSSGAPVLPLGRVASGGELARTMLALELELTAGPSTLVFDEVDAGVGGQAAVAVGAALQSLAQDHQIFVVTHLAQVAAHADHHIRLLKLDDGRVTETRAERLEEHDRVVELSRMLSGSPESDAAREHATELLVAAAAAGARYGGTP